MSLQQECRQGEKEQGLSAAESRPKAPLEKSGRKGGFPGTLKRPGSPSGAGRGWTGGKDPLFMNTADRGPI